MQNVTRNCGVLVSTSDGVVQDPLYWSWDGMVPDALTCGRSCGFGPLAWPHRGLSRWPDRIVSRCAPMPFMPQYYSCTRAVDGSHPIHRITMSVSVQHHPPLGGGTASCMFHCTTHGARWAEAGDGTVMS